MLPASALPIYEKMVRHEGLGQLKISTQSGQVNGVAGGGRYLVYAVDDPRRHELHDRPSAHHIVKETPSLAQPVPSQATLAGGGDPLGYTDAQLHEVVISDQKFQELVPLHQAWVTKEYKQLCYSFSRYLARKPNMHLKTWDQVTREARAELKRRFDLYMQHIHQHFPEVLGDMSDTLDSLANVQFKVFLAYYRHKYPIPTDALPELQADIRRKHSVTAMLRQRQLLRQWTTQAAHRAGVHDGERYRKEKDRIMDLWTGHVEDFATFDERNRLGNIQLTAEMLPLAAPTVIVAPQAQEQDQTQPPSQLQSQGRDGATPGEAQSQQQKQAMQRTQLLARMQEKAQAQPQAAGQQQSHAGDEAQVRADILKQTSDPVQERMQTQSQAQGPVGDRSQHQGQMDTEMTDSDTAQAPVLPEPQDHMEVDTMPRMHTQNRGHAGPMLTPSHGSEHTMEEFHAQLRAAAHDDTGNTPFVSTSALMQRQGPFSMKAIVQEQQRTEQHAPPGPEARNPLPSQENIGPQTHASIQTQAVPQIPTAEMQSEALFRGIIQAGLQRSLESTLSVPSQLSNHESPPAAPEKQLDTDGPNNPLEKASAESTESAQPREAMPAELLQVSEAQELDQDEMDLTVQGSTAGVSEDEDQMQHELEDSSEPQSTPQQSSEGCLTPDESEMSEPSDAFAEGPNLSQDETVATASSPAACNDQATEKAQLSEQIKRCNFCTQTQSNCNGERPCQVCIKHKRNCYEVGQKPPPPKSRKGTNLEPRLTAKKQTGDTVDQEQLVDDSALESQANELMSEESSLDDSQIEATIEEQDHDVNMEASESELSEIEDEEDEQTLPADTPKPAVEMTIPKANKAQSKTKSKALPKRKQSPRRLSNVTTRLAEQKTAKEGRRSLRSRDVSK